MSRTLQNATATLPNRGNWITATIRGTGRIASKLAPKATGRLAFRNWFKPGKTPVSRADKAALASAHRRDITWNNLRIATYSWGKGPIVLFVHGWRGNAGQINAWIDPLTAEGYQVVAFDAPAHGNSEGNETDVDMMRRLIQQITREYGSIDTLIGHSLGALAGGLALHYGLSVRRVININGLVRLSRVLTWIQEGLGINDQAIAEIKRLSAFRFPDFGMKLMDKLRHDFMATQWTIPGLIIHDREDPWIHVEHAEELHRSWRESKLVVTEGLGHSRILSEPRIIAEGLRFIQETSQGATRQMPLRTDPKVGLDHWLFNPERRPHRAQT